MHGWKISSCRWLSRLAKQGETLLLGLLSRRLITPQPLAGCKPCVHDHKKKSQKKKHYEVFSILVSLYVYYICMYIVAVYFSIFFFSFLQKWAQKKKKTTEYRYNGDKRIFFSNFTFFLTDSLDRLRHYENEVRAFVVLCINSNSI